MLIEKRNEKCLTWRILDIFKFKLKHQFAVALK